MKKLVRALLVLAISFIGVFALQKTTFAESVIVSDFDTFKSYCRNEGGEIKLGADITISGSNVFVKKELSLDLNGHTITATNSGSTKYMLIVDGGTLTISDSSSDNSGLITGTYNYFLRIGNSNPGTVIMNSGNISGDYGVHVVSGDFIMNGGKITASNAPVLAQGGNFTLNDGLIEASSGMGLRGYASTSTLTINGGTVRTLGDSFAINSTNGTKIVINGGTVEALYAGTTEGAGGNGVAVYKNGSLEVNGGIIHSASSTILSNGSIEENNISSGTNAKFTITGGEIISDKHTAVYAPQFRGSTTISGGSLTGHDSAIELRAGDLTITGGTFVATRETFETENNTSGTTTKGAAITIAQHTTTDEMNISICGGTFRGAVALAEVNPIANSPEDIAKITLLIDEPCGDLTFDATSDDAIISEDFTNFIKGGSYNRNVTPYVHEGYFERNRNGRIIVTNENDPEEGTNPNTIDNIKFYIVAISLLLGTTPILKSAKKR